MSLFGSLITGVSALGAQAQSISMIANNIANVNTVGYKRREAAFSSLVTSESRNARYTPGSVLARAIQKIDGQGALQQTNSTTDVAISGNGFFVVQRTPTGLQEKLFTRAGSFSEDANGYLRNTAGFYLMGWRIDENGALPAGRDDISSTEAVNVSLLGGLTKATTTAEFAINLDAAEAPSAWPVGSSTAADFKRTVRVFDSLGEGQNLELQFTKHESPTAFALSSFVGTGTTRTTLLTATTGVNPGEEIVVNVGDDSATFTITATSTVQDLINFVNDDTTLQQVATAQLTENGQIRITARNFGETVAITNGAQSGSAGAAAAIGFTTMAPYNHTTGAVGVGTGLLPTTVLDGIANVDDTETLSITVGLDNHVFTITATNTVQDLIDSINTNMAGVASASLDQNGAIRIMAMDAADTVAVTNGVVVGTGAATAMGFTAVAGVQPTVPTPFPDSGLDQTANTFGWWQLSLVDLDTGTILNQGSLNFNSDGSLNGAANINGIREVMLTNVNWGNGSELQDISLDIGGLTQFSGEYNVTAASQNGAELGLRTGVEIDRNGIVSARFSNGQTSKLFQLPLATFTAVNGLSEQSGNSFIQSAESGSYNLREAGNGGAGLVEGSSVETSNVDIADEFTKMIVTQRSYSAGTKVIRTADEMTEELLRLR